MKITYLAAISRDGFIAREDGDVSWLDELNIDAGETGLQEFFDDIDGLLMGRRTYDFVFQYGSWPYEDKPTWVCTHRELVRLEGANLFVVDNLDSAIDAARKTELNHLWLVGGGQLASSMLDANLLTHISLSEMPIELGTGIPLFSNHQLDDIPVRSKQRVPKNGFQQIEIVCHCSGSDH